jgi:hypothetical protein
MAKSLMAMVAPIKNERWIPPTSAKVDELRVARRAANEEAILLEKAGIAAQPRPPGESTAARGARLLDDVPDPVSLPPVRDESYRLHELREKVIVIDAAIAEGMKRITAEIAERSRALVTQNASAWKALQRQRALAVMALFKANRQIESLQTEIASGGEVPNLPLAGFSLKLFGSYVEQNVTGHWAREFVKQAVQYGIVSEEEVRENV